LKYGKSSCNPEIRGFAFCWERSVPLSLSLDLAPGQLMLGFLDGSASTFED
jgi:hypothetical protein